MIQLGFPGPNMPTKVSRGVYCCTNGPNRGGHNVRHDSSIGTWDNFNDLLGKALNAAEAGEIRAFAMIHADVRPFADGWLDSLAAEMDRLGADLVSVAVPIKDERGLASCGIGDPENHWAPLKRFTMRELFKLPETFNAADAGYPGLPLLHNNGCWIANLKSPVFFQETEDGTNQAFFQFPKRLYRDPVTGKWRLAGESEDWYFSRCLHELGAKTYITRKVQLAHIGECEFPNDRPWGTLETDDRS